MRPYEVMMIFDIGTEPTSIQATIERVLETVRTTGGNPGQVDRWGRRPFAYEVNHKNEGYYVLVEFSGEVRTVDAVGRLLTLADEVVRHKIIRIPEKMVGKTRGPSSNRASSGRRPPEGPGRARAGAEAAAGPSVPRTGVPQTVGRGAEGRGAEDGN